MLTATAPLDQRHARLMAQIEQLPTRPGSPSSTGFMRYLTPGFGAAIIPARLLNIHPSLLPKHNLEICPSRELAQLARGAASAKTAQSYACGYLMTENWMVARWGRTGPYSGDAGD